MRTLGEGKYKIFLEEKRIGSDIIYFLYGGDKPHIGGIVCCEVDKEPYVISLGSHYDSVVLLPLAKKGCEKYKTTVVAVGGIHIDNATKEEIEIIQKNCEKITNQI